MWKKKYNRYILYAILLTPFWMWMAWVLTPKKKLMVGIIDKTVLTKKGQEHISLMWVLNHEKFAKINNDLYETQRDYFGFFPLGNEKYKVKGLERFSSAKLNQLSEDCDMAYLTDAYGIYNNEWYQRKNITERSGIVYGGMSQQDLDFLLKMKQKKKLVIAEFNCLGSPTSINVRSGFENAFGMKWTGWIGRYFDILDTAINQELPKWLVNNYIAQHGGKWPFKKSGIAFVREDDRVVILENQTHLSYELPQMFSRAKAIEEYDLPKKINYSFWFDINTVDTSVNEVLADFKIPVNKAGATELQKEGIPQIFPSIISHNKEDYKFWYFCADYCDNPISNISSYFKGISFFRRMFYNTTDPAERRNFFWNVYRPLVTKILDDYQETLK